RSSLKNELLSYTDTDLLKTQQIFNVELIRNIVLNHLSSKEDNTFQVWTFFCFQKWYSHVFLKN
ncbi:hypothetical protein EZS27_011782, partial [termite gut metagenome]